MDEAATKLRISRRWLQDFIREHPYYRTAGRKKLFADEDIARLIEAMPCPGNSLSHARTKRHTGTSGGRTSALLWTKAQELLTAPRPSASSRRGERKPNVVSLDEGRKRRLQHS
jgi:hypothetical protein